jgi:hypothetical protein
MITIHSKFTRKVLRIVFGTLLCIAAVRAFPIGLFSGMAMMSVAVAVAIWWYFSPVTALRLLPDSWLAYAQTVALLCGFAGAFLFLNSFIGVFVCVAKWGPIGLSDPTFRETVIREALRSAMAIFSLGFAYWFFGNEEPHFNRRLEAMSPPKPRPVAGPPKPEPEPVSNSVEPFDGTKLVLGLASFIGIFGRALEKHDDMPSLGGGSAPSGQSWHDGSGKEVKVRTDGSVVYNGQFIGRRDASGRIVDGNGRFQGTLKDTGEFHGSDGQYQGRVFR